MAAAVADLAAAVADPGARPAMRAPLLLFVMALGVADHQLAWAQDTGLSRTLVRSGDIAGLPAVEFDLSVPSLQRYALVIGNGDYETVPDLPNASADATLVASQLRASGFTVAEHHDLTKGGFESALRQMLHEVEFGAELFIFFAGHGVQIGNRNYLIPTDAEITSLYDIPFTTISMNSMMAVASARARSLTVILDSCRDNPFSGQKGMVQLDGVPADLQTGFTAQDTPINSLVIFSTSPGAVALDGEGENSPFTQALVETMQAQPDTPLDESLKDVRRRVYELTGTLQVPWESSSLVESIYINRPGGGPLWAVDADAQETGAETAMDITADLDPKVSLGGQLRGSMPGETTQRFGISPPQNGRIEVQRDGRYYTLPHNATLSADELTNVIYRPNSADLLNPTSRGLLVAPVQDNFTVSSGSMIQRVQLSLDVNACDRAAGDLLDPQGVGVARFANEIVPEEAIASCQAAVAEMPSTGRFHYQLGRAQLALRQFDAARVSYERAQELGHVRAIHGLGVLEAAKVTESGGLAGGRAPQTALDFYAAGVERGDPFGYHSLGRQLLLYPQTPDDRRQGFELLSRSLELGHTFSMNALGLYFLDENADHYNAERGLRYLRESNARGDIYGAANLAYVAASGAGDQTVDPQRALELYRVASDGGHPTAPSGIGRLFNSGALGRPDFAEAVRWFDIALARGDGWGGSNAAWIIANRNPTGFGPGQAGVRAAKAATLRNPGPAQEARNLLSSLPNREIDAAAQVLVRDLGQDITVDGAWGPGSQAALDTLSARLGLVIPSDRTERLLALAAAHWKNTKFRVDLY